jgi:hypothetical protein
LVDTTQALNYEIDPTTGTITIDKTTGFLFNGTIRAESYNSGSFVDSHNIVIKVCGYETVDLKLNPLDYTQLTTIGLDTASTVNLPGIFFTYMLSESKSAAT